MEDADAGCMRDLFTSRANNASVPFARALDKRAPLRVPSAPAPARPHNSRGQQLENEALQDLRRRPRLHVAAAGVAQGAAAAPAHIAAGGHGGEQGWAQLPAGGERGGRTPL